MEDKRKTSQNEGPKATISTSCAISIQIHKRRNVKIENTYGTNTFEKEVREHRNELGQLFYRSINTDSINRL